MNSKAQGRTGMFLRLLLRAAISPPGRIAGALLAVVVAAAAGTAMLNVYVDVQSKLQHEFRSYGANIAIVPRNRQQLPDDTLQKVDAVIGGRGIAAPFGYAVARTAKGEPIVVAGTEMQRAKTLNHWWKVEPQWPEQLGDALIGSHAARVLGSGNSFQLTFNGNHMTVNPTGVLTTGDPDDDRIYLSMEDFRRFTSAGISTIQIAVNGSTADETIRALASALPEAEVRPLRQIVEAEGKVIEKTRSTLLAAALLIIITAVLCMVATLSAWVLDRRKDFAIMKALGASERLIAFFFATEAACIGTVGALAGFFLGIGVAAWIGRANFHAALEPRFSILPVVLAASVAAALISAIVPVSLLRRIQPAAMLRGE